MTREEAIEAMDRKWRVRITNADADAERLGWFDGTIHSIQGKHWCQVELANGSLQGVMTKHVCRLKHLRQ